MDSTLESIRSAFSSKLEAARSAVSGAIGRIKSCFNFSWSLPSLKLPHISISGSFSINPPSVPKFGISWYKDGGILNGATIFGAMGGKLLGGGEAGAEAVLPLSELWKQMTEIVRGVVKGENEESGDSVQQTGASITSALTSKAASVRKGELYEATLKILDKNKQPDSRFPEVPGVKTDILILKNDIVAVVLMYGECSPYIIGRCF